ncbi:MAG TPA: sodium:solute symporter family protein [Balneolales bacterium]|nr:sodium:solute symporter family protein [Balneolales bacterium]
MHINFSYIDWAIVLVYFVAIVWLSLKKQWQDVDEETFLLSGRKMTLPAFIATLVSTWYGGILGVGEYSYQYGVSEWILLGLPFYVFSILFAYLLAEKIRHNPALSIPEALSNQYGSRAGNTSALGVFILVSPAPYILMLGLLFQFMFGGNGNMLIYAILVSLFSVLYVSFGGFDAVVRTDDLQVILMYVGFFVLLFYAWHVFGSPVKLWNHVPEKYKDFTGGHSIQYILVWFFIALWTFVDPSFHQRAAAARTPEVAKKGILYSVLFWTVFDFLSLSCGVYGFKILGHIDKPAMVYPYLADKILPVGMRGLFYVALLATIMSTLDSYLFLSGQTLGRDLLAKIFPKAPRVLLTRVSVLLAAALGILLIVLYPSVISLWYVIGSVMIPGLLIPVLGIYLPIFRLKREYVLPLMILSTGISILWLGLGSFHASEKYSEAFLGIEPFYPGMLVSFVLWIIGRDKEAEETIYMPADENSYAETAND